MNNENRVEKALKSFDGMKRADAPAFMIGRVLQRIHEKKNHGFWEKGAQFFLRPAVAFSLVTVVLLLNIYLFSNLTSSSENISSLPGYEYSLSDFAIVENENTWP